MVHKLTDIIITFILQHFSNDNPFTSLVQNCCIHIHPTPLPWVMPLLLQVVVQVGICNFKWQYVEVFLVEDMTFSSCDVMLTVRTRSFQSHMVFFWSQIYQ